MFQLISKMFLIINVLRKSDTHTDNVKVKWIRISWYWFWYLASNAISRWSVGTLICGENGDIVRVNRTADDLEIKWICIKVFIQLFICYKIIGVDHTFVWIVLLQEYAALSLLNSSLSFTFKSCCMVFTLRKSYPGQFLIVKTVPRLFLAFKVCFMQGLK